MTMLLEFLERHRARHLFRSSHVKLLPFSSPESAILVVSARDRDLWQGPKQEVCESRTSGFCSQPQKFETITVTIRRE